MSDKTLPTMLVTLNPNGMLDMTVDECMPMFENNLYIMEHAVKLREVLKEHGLENKTLREILDWIEKQKSRTEVTESSD